MLCGEVRVALGCVGAVIVLGLKDHMLGVFVMMRL